jgi:hypothetical protein
VSQVVSQVIDLCVPRKPRRLGSRVLSSCVARAYAIAHSASLMGSGVRFCTSREISGARLFKVRELLKYVRGCLPFCQINSMFFEFLLKNVELI